MLCELCLLPVLLEKIELALSRISYSSEGAAGLGRVWQGQRLSAPGLIQPDPCKNPDTFRNTDKMGTKFPVRLTNGHTEVDFSAPSLQSQNKSLAVCVRTGQSTQIFFIAKNET